MNADGSAPKYLYGINADEPAIAYGDVLGKIDDRHILIQSYPYGVKDGIPEALKVNIYSGRISREARSRLRGASFVHDEDMAPRFVQGIDDDNEQVFSYRPRGSRDWKDLKMPFGDRAQVVGFEPESDVLRVIGSHTGDKRIRGLYRFDPSSGESSWFLRLPIRTLSGRIPTTNMRYMACKSIATTASSYCSIRSIGHKNQARAAEQFPQSQCLIGFKDR